MNQPKAAISEIDSLEKPEIRREVDEPFSRGENAGRSIRLSDKDVDNLERTAKSAKLLQGLRVQSWAIKLLIGCMIVLLVLSVAEICLINSGLIPGEPLPTLVDFTKYTVTVLLGFLFASRSSRSDE